MSVQRPYKFRREKAGDTPLLKTNGLLILDGILLLGLILLPFLIKLLLTVPMECYVRRHGYLCPSCGGTRAVALLLNGRIRDAFFMNPYLVGTGVCVLIGVLLLHVTAFWRNAFLCRLSRGLFHPYTVVIWAFGFVFFGILRNFV